MKAEQSTVYFGWYSTQLKYGRCKIGETQQKYPTNRFSMIRNQNKKSFRELVSITVKGMTKAEIYYIESYVRMYMSRVNGLEYDEDSNDHFDYLIEKGNRKNQIINFADEFEKIAIKGLKEIGYTTDEMKIKKYRVY